MFKVLKLHSPTLLQPGRVFAGEPYVAVHVALLRVQADSGRALSAHLQVDGGRCQVLQVGRLVDVDNDVYEPCRVGK